MPLCMSRGNSGSGGEAARILPVPAVAAPRGFTILEMVLALVILTFLTGAIFAILHGATSAATDIQRLHRENHRFEEFFRQCRRVVATLPSNGTIELKVIADNPLVQELIIRGAPEAFLFGPDPTRDPAEITIALRRYEDVAPEKKTAAAPAPAEAAETEEQTRNQTRHYLAISTPGFFKPRDPAHPEPAPLPPAVILDREGRYWLPLLEDIAEAKWEIFEPAKKIWHLKQGPGRPPLIRLSLLPFGRKSPIIVVFTTP